MKANKYASDGHLYAPGERAESQARFICFGYYGDPVEDTIYPYNVGRNHKKLIWRIGHGVRK